jgi:hypothetical protein
VLSKIRLTHLQHTSIAGTNDRLLEHDLSKTILSDCTSLVGTGHVNKAAIFNTEGTSVWATTPGFSPTAPELREVVKSYSDTGEFKAVQSTGFYIAGEKYITLRADDRSLYGKKVCENCA